MDIKNIKPYPGNPRKNDAAVEAVARSIEAFGFRAPIIVDKDHVIIAGHTRYKAARLLELEKVPVVVAKDLTPAQVKAYRIADNKTGEKAEWDVGLLKVEIEELKPLDIDIELTGFDLKEIAALDIKNQPTAGTTELIDELFGIYIECETEEQQIELLSRFDEEGLKCRALIS